MALDKTKVSMVDGLPATFVEDFTDLTDAPSTYAGAGGQTVKVKAGEDGLEFGATASGGDTWTGVFSSVSKHQNDTTGYVEIWGSTFVGDNASVVVSFAALSGIGISALANATYHVSLTSTNTDANNQDNVVVTSRSTTSFTIQNNDNEGSGETVLWKVTGNVSV